MKILMVCLGNICRSPLAEGILQSKLPNNFIVDSAGTINMHEGKKPDDRSIRIGQNYDIDISKQKSRPFKLTDFEEFDYIFCMDKNNLRDVLSMAKTDLHRQKVSLILADNREVTDPYYGGMTDFDYVYQLLDARCEIVADELMNKIKEPSKK